MCVWIGVFVCVCVDWVVVVVCGMCDVMITVGERNGKGQREQLRTGERKERTAVAVS